MAFKARERLFETSVSTGTGSFTLAGATQGGRRFNDVLSVSDTFWYKIVDISAAAPYPFEAGLGTYSGSHVFARTTVIESSNSDALVNFGSGTKLVFMEAPAKTLQTIYERATNALQIGKHSLWIPAGAMTQRVTNGPAAGVIQMTTNLNMVRTLDFDPTTQEFAQFDVRMPKSWDEGSVTFKALWSHAATVTNFGVAWGLDAVAISDDDPLDVAFGTEQVVTDTGGTTNDAYHTAESAAITIAGTPQPEDLVMFRVHRNPAHASDNLTVDARLHGVTLYYTTNAENDA